MPLRLDVKKKLNTCSERVKSVCFHPVEPWVLSGLYSGIFMIHNWETQALVKTVEVSQLPIRCAKFIARKQWVIAAGDDMYIRVYNYDTLEKIKEFDAHSDYIRYLAVHSTLPYVLSASDDLTVKLWSWESDWIRLHTFEGHAHYVMMCQWNPRDSHIFATASLDRTIKVWGISNSSLAVPGGSCTSPHFVLTGHERGVNCIEYSPSGERPYIVSGSDDKMIKVWDYQTKLCVATLQGHTRNVSAAVFHPRLPVIISTSEDGTVRVWHSNTYRLENTMAYHMDRGWALATQTENNNVTIGFDEGTVVIKLGGEKPVTSLQGGKIVWAKGTDIQTVNLKFVDDSLYGDGERLHVAVKELGACEIFPQSLSHHPNGRFIAVCGDDEYIIYTSQALRSKSYGKAVELCWSPDGLYATRDESRVTVFSNFKESNSMKPSFPVNGLFGGHLLGLRSNDFICFFSWPDLRLIRRIEATPSHLWWSENGMYLCLACQDSFFILRHDRDAVQAAINSDIPPSEEGIEAAFEFVCEVNEKVETGVWVAECFVFVTSNLRLQMMTAGQNDSIAYLDKKMFILGYIPDNHRLYLIDSEMNIVTYHLNLSYVEYITAICRKEFANAAEHFAKIPSELHTKTARFLEHQGHLEDALQITKESDHKFELALSLGKLDLCASIVKASDGTPGSENSMSNFQKMRWAQLGDAALEHSKLDLAILSFSEAEDCQGILLVAVSTGNAELLKKAGEIAKIEKKLNVVILSQMLLGEVEECVQTLVDAKRLPEAAAFSRTYCPHKLKDVMPLWKADLQKTSPMLGSALANPFERPELFNKFDISIQADELLRKKRELTGLPPASQYKRYKEMLDIDIICDIEKMGYKKVRDIFLSDFYDVNSGSEEDDIVDNNGTANGFLIDNEVGGKLQPNSKNNELLEDDLSDASLASQRLSPKTPLTTGLPD